MALAKLHSASTNGVDALPIIVEADVATGLPCFTLVGLADRAVDESRERVRSTIKHASYQFPLSRITINLTPSNYKKSGIHYDLPIAVAILLADGQIETNLPLEEVLLIGALSLDGALQPIPGTLIFVEWAKKAGFKTVAVPYDNYYEAALIPDIEILPFKTFNEVVNWLIRQELPEKPPAKAEKDSNYFDEDWLQIQGQEQAKRAALIATSGGHNLLLEGPPGSGKTLLAKGMRALLPPPDHEDLVEIVKLHSLAGLTPQDEVTKINRPFRSPHHTASSVAVIGGGSQARPGEISLAHNGILFLDELPEFPRSVIESLRQPLEDGEVFITRVEKTTHYPANFILVATMNPCPCGWLNSGQKDCKCSAFEVNQYRKKISGPILDRIDLCLTMPFVEVATLKGQANNTEELATYRKQVIEARSRQIKRNNGKLNAEITGRKVADICRLSPEADVLATTAAKKFVLTGRGYHKLLKVARSIADLANHEVIEAGDVAEAIQYRLQEN